MLAEAELRTLTALHGRPTVSELADRLDRSTSYTSELVSQLEDAGIVSTTREGRAKRIQRSDARMLDRFDEITQRHGHVDWPELLGGSALRLLYFLDEPRSPADLARCADVHRSTVHRTLKPLTHRGIVIQGDDGTYALQERFGVLADFARELAHHHHRTNAGSVVDEYTLLWESLDEFLVQTPGKIEHEAFVLTGPARFKEYDVPLLTRDRRYYFYSETQSVLSPATLCCHTLLIDTGTRSLSYCLLLLSHADVDEAVLRSDGTKYGVEEWIDHLLTYLETDGDERTPELPSWEEFGALADDYGVTI